MTADQLPQPPEPSWAKRGFDLNQLERYGRECAQEAVKQECERIMAILKERHETFVGLAAHFYEREMPEVATRDSAVATQLEYIIGLLKDHP